MGTEDVRSAGSQMRSAAEDMKRAASQIESAFETHERFLTNWLMDFRQALEPAKEK
jgi:Sec-independent protein translocase protein TatA